jgi:hypothetical protein
MKAPDATFAPPRIQEGYDMDQSDFADEVLRGWTRDAAFVFSGRVQALGASNLDGVEPDERMATVQVEEVALAPRDLGDLRGRTVTIYLETTEGLEAGQQATFFAQGWHYGRNIGVIEVSGVRGVGRTSFRAADLREAVLAERLRQFEEQIEERIRDAEVILSGRVLKTYRAERPEGLPGLDEGVEWWNADLWIASVEMGQPPDEQRIWFPEGGDREWGPVPKAYPGQTGVWLLRPVVEPGEEGAEPRGRRSQSGRAEEQPEAAPERRLMAVDPLDYHAMADLPRIQTLLWRVTEG